MSNPVTVAVDADGGDDGFEPVLEGVAAALESEPSLEVALCGLPEHIGEFCSSHSRCVPIACGQPIDMGEHPAEAVKSKKDSSIVTGCKLVASRSADAFFSAGSTGACLVAATLHIGRIRGVKRPALGIMVPAYEHPTLLLDVGANADCKPEFLVQFAIMGACYVKSTCNISSPKVALLNIGSEPTKGSVLAQQTYDLMKENVLNFQGNCESADLLSGCYDVVVTDGFTGNVCLKSMESTAKLMLRLIKDSMQSSLSSKVKAAFVKSSLQGVKDRLNPEEFGGSPLIGIDGACIVGHGASNAKAVKNGILKAYSEASCNVIANIEETLRVSKEKDTNTKTDTSGGC